MKNKFKILSVSAAVLALSACSGTSSQYNAEYDAPYSQSRTATHATKVAPVSVAATEKKVTKTVTTYTPKPKAEMVFKKAVTK